MIRTLPHGLASRRRVPPSAFALLRDLETQRLGPDVEGVPQVGKSAASNASGAGRSRRYASEPSASTARWRATSAGSTPKLRVRREDAPARFPPSLMVPLAPRKHLEAPERALPHLAPQEGPIMEQLLSVKQAAELLGTTDRFPRRLIAERRVRFIHVGGHVRIPLSALEDLIRDGTVEPTGARTQSR
jgi:excisionase family DNA binding protein